LAPCRKVVDRRPGADAPQGDAFAPIWARCRNRPVRLCTMIGAFGWFRLGSVGSAALHGKSLEWMLRRKLLPPIKEGQMAKIVGVHGLGHQFAGEQTLLAQCYPAFKDGLERAGRKLASGRDFVALVKERRPRIGAGVMDHQDHNGAKVHDVTRYLTTRELGDAVASGP
jgi:hypothetical protein